MRKKNGKNESDLKTDRAKALALERRHILALPPEKTLDAILEHPYPVTLVQSMAEEDLYLLVHTIGPDDALQVLGLASNEQWQYLLDMDLWQRDRADPHVMTEWMNRLLKADPDRFTHWIVNEQRDALEYYLSRNIEVHIREYEEDPAEVGEDFFSEDDVHYVRMRPYPPTDENSSQRQETRDLFLKDLLRRLAVYDYPLYQGLLVNSATVISAENEEELLRLRNMRLAEKGFLPFEEAVGVYQPLKVDDLFKRSRKPAAVAGRAVDSYPLRVDTTDVPEDANLFTQTLARIQDEIVLQRLQSEFAGLCNQIIAADQHVVRDKTALSQVVAKVGNYISIGLEQTQAEAGRNDPYLAANLVQSYLLADIFRVGYGCALQLKWQAERWRRESWFDRVGLPLAFWGEAWLGALGGLLIKKPLFFDNYATGVLYREFATLADVHQAGRLLNAIIAMDDLLSRMAVQIPHLEVQTFVTCQNAVLTLWAHRCLRMDTPPGVPAPLAMDRFRDFFNTLWVEGTAAPRIKDSMREHFLDWLAQSSGLATYEIAEKLSATMEDWFHQIESDLGRVAPEDLDPRFIHVFLLQA